MKNGKISESGVTRKGKGIMEQRKPKEGKEKFVEGVKEGIY